MKRCLAALVVIAFALAACGGQPASQTLPTLIPTPGGVQPSATPTVASAESTTEPTQVPLPLTRPTLPPTWTPAPGDQTNSTDNTAVTNQPLATATLAVSDTPAPVATEVPTLVVCGGFVANRNKSTSTFTVGATPQIFWTNVDTAARYRIRLLDDTGAELFVDFSLQPTYTFRADLFQKNKVYAWSVYPEDSLGQQMCTERGAELYPQ